MSAGDTPVLVRPALLLVGFGNVARRFVRLLEELRPALTALGIEPVVVGIATRRHGSTFNAAGLQTNALFGSYSSSSPPRTIQFSLRLAF